MDELPGQCNYLSLGAARIQEIKAIISKLDKCEHGGRAFQNLPRHMQRRAVSSHPKRLPRYLQERHKREGGANVKPSHRPRRKYRRRPFNLLAEYNRRQKEFVWLETHIWHAKRFHMKRLWGYALPESPTFKGYRATLRAATQSCLLQDVSYLCCIELKGPRTSLVAGLSCIMQPSSLVLVTSSQVQHGQSWTSVMLFEPGRQPYGALGDVDILWHPTSSDMPECQSKNSAVWIWVHPSVHSQVVGVLAQVFQLLKITNVSEIVSRTENSSCDRSNGNEVELMEEEAVAETGKMLENVSSDNVQSELLPSPNNETPKEKNEKVTDDSIKDLNSIKDVKPGSVTKLKLEGKNVPFERTPKYASNDKTVTMTLLKDTINRFQLTGPKSFSVLMAALSPANIAPEIEDIDVDSSDKSQDSLHSWWQQYYHDEVRLLCHQQQVSAWKKLASSPQPTQVVLPLTVRDPRVTLPHKKIPIAAVTSEQTEKVEHPDWPAFSPLYDSKVRDIVSQSKEPDALINKRRSQLLVPGSDIPESIEEMRLPVLLLSRPPTSRKQGSGWDVVVAAGWGMSVWMPLIFCGAAVGGQQESENLNMEILSPLPPHLLPDTPAGNYYSAWLGKQKRTQFFKRPPANRYNFIKLGVQYPFCAPWRKLLQEWEPGTQDIYVLRDIRLVNGLCHMIGDAIKKFRKRASKRKATNNLEDIPHKKLQTCKSEGNIYDLSVFSSDDGASKDSEVIKKPLTESHNYSEQFHELLSQRCSLEEFQKLNYGCLVTVKLILQYKGILEPYAMICLPHEDDIEARDKLMMPTNKKESILEFPHDDTQVDKRTKLKEEHAKIKGRLQRLRRKAKLKLTMEKDIVAMAGSSGSMEKATTDALIKVNEENKVILAKYSSFQEEMENAWLMETNKPLQCCSRKIMGYVINGNFCQTLGRGAGIGWVALKPLLEFFQVCKKINEKFVESNNDSETHDRIRIDNEFQIDNKWKYSVLVRNPSGLQYHWAKLLIVNH
ncbi:ribonucleases P/MRP protein subunit POP1 [Procambarus clarkii]|uniref:ribonucleases P/MRP protein subunit POP1 n=1 Tax=Procambarus clarkii TaxID=6728 RepID=UPI001E677BA3|nr:ribonucleases P/MRP protein subunit POP1-like [Procambarus clarkii]